MNSEFYSVEPENCIEMPRGYQRAPIPSSPPTTSTFLASVIYGQCVTTLRCDSTCSNLYSRMKITEHCPSCACIMHFNFQSRVELPEHLAIAADATIVRISDELENQRQALLMLRRKRNDCLPIARISELCFHRIEILILQYGLKRWLPLLHVSSKWRTIALSNPELYQYRAPLFPFADRFPGIVGSASIVSDDR